MWRAQRREEKRNKNGHPPNYSWLNFKMMGEKPKGIPHPKGKLEHVKDIRHRLKILAINAGCLPSKKELLRNYIVDWGAHMVVATEPNLTSSGLAGTALRGSTLMNYGCREDLQKRGRGAAAESSFMCTSAPRVSKVGISGLMRKENWRSVAQDYL